MAEALEAIRQMESGFSSTEKSIARYILNDPSHVINLSIHEMAHEIGVSASSITRFCRTVGFDSLRELRMSVVRSVDEKAADDIRDAVSWLDDSDQLASNYLVRVNDVFQQTLQLNSMETLRKVAHLICDSDAVYLFGIGASALAAENLLGKLTKLHMRCIYNSDADMAAQMASSASPKDVAIAFSYSGTSRDVLRAAKSAKASGCPLITVSRKSSTPLARVSDTALYVPAVEQVTRVTTLFTNYSQSLLVDVLFLLVTQMSDVDPDETIEWYRKTSSEE